ncbi:MAG: response regulator transcription factor [Patescibacteria group bacterium]
MKKKILLVEDEVTMRETLQDVFEEAGLEVDAASDGKEGLEKIKENKYNLVLLDLILPKKNGFEVLEEVKREKIKAPVLLLTNLSGMEDVQKALALGAKSYLVKSDYKPKEILEKVKENLE